MSPETSLPEEYTGETVSTDLPATFVAETEGSEDRVASDEGRVESGEGEPSDAEEESTTDSRLRGNDQTSEE